MHVCSQAQKTDGSLQSIVHNAVNDPSAQAAFAHVMEAAATETKAISQISGPSMAPAPGVRPSCFSPYAALIDPFLSFELSLLPAARHMAELHWTPRTVNLGAIHDITFRMRCVMKRLCPTTSTS